MDMSNVRPELHVAQQSRRDKLRIQQSSAPIQHFEDFTNNLEPSPVNHSRLNPDLVQVRHVRNANFLHDPTLLSSSVINFSVDSDALSAQREAMLAFGANLPNMSHPASLSTFHAPIKVTGHDPNGCENWKGLDSQQSYDWMVNYANEHAVTGRVSNQNAVFVGEVLSNDVKVNNVSAPTQCLMPNYDGCQDVQSSLTNPSSEISSQDSQKHYGDMRFGSSASLYQNGLQNVVTVACVGTQNMGETGRGSWSGSGDELALLPSYGNQSNALRFDGCNAWWNRPVVDSHPWSGELSCIARKSDQELSNVATDATMQGLSLSLSSNPLPKMCATQFAEGFDSHHLHLRASGLNEAEDSKTVKSGYLSSITKPPMLGKSNGKSIQDVVGTSNHVQRHSGPLGPFTGYATILKSSRFLKPAQELLDDFCCATKLAKTYGTYEGISGEASASASIGAAANAAEAEAGAKVNNSGASSSTFHCFSDIGGEAGVGSSSCESYRPEYQQKKAKLLYLQEEVCRRYKLYYQQMEMVVSSFESVSGLRAAAPYVSLALKTISRNFRCMKSAISEQIKHVLMASGEDLLSPAAGASSSKGDMNMSKLKYMERHKNGGENVGFLESQHVWRPQRGLPERSVAILRAWLFDHFLHPYPTDTDKHMLATQTGLSRNQVSNWFINARVRVWKPMVEEIHMLETKGLVEANQASSRSNLKSVSEGTSRPNSDQEKNKVGVKVTPDKQFECSGIGSLMGTDEEAEQWNQEKPLGLECQVPASMDGSLMGFVPFQRSGLDQIGGVGSVSLTLGLRHGVESAQKQQQLQHQEDQLRQQFGGQMIHDFVG